MARQGGVEMLVIAKEMVVTCEECEDQPATMDVWMEFPGVGTGQRIARVCKSCSIAIVGNYIEAGAEEGEM